VKLRAREYSQSGKGNLDLLSQNTAEQGQNQDQSGFHCMITKFIERVLSLNFSVITRGFDIKVCMLKGPEGQRASSSLSDQEEGFRLWSFQEFFSNHDWIPQLVHLFVDDTRWRDDE
ncbi:hypothetical protein Tco_1055299, partial [Tanacetum coccineum]